VRSGMDRVNDILLGPLERPALAWMCRRMPAWVTPDQLTVLGIAGGVLTLSGFWLTRVHEGFLWLASAGLVVNWLGDSLDGNLARYRKIERPKYGYFVDHIADALVTSLICVGLGLSAYVRMSYALGALVTYLMLSILTYVTSQVTGVFRLSYGRFGPTEVRLVIILGCAVCLVTPNPVVRLGPLELRAFELVTLVVIVLLALSFLADAIRTARSLAALEPRRRRTP